MTITSPKLSLSDLLGREYISAVCGAAAALELLDYTTARALADEKVDFYPPERQALNLRLLHRVGERICPVFENDEHGATTDSFARAAHNSSAPLSGACCMRVGEDGRLWLLGKSEHYHASLGHAFPGYALLDRARALGIPNATHNNTRGYITRRTERALIAAANGLADGDAALADVLASRAPHVLNRVLNLETGSVAVEAGIKMMLARFYRFDSASRPPKYEGRTPVFFVMADETGGSEANYHGTSVIAQTLRGLWPDLAERQSTVGAYLTVPVGINDPDDFAEKMARYNSGAYKTAGFLHELVLMNYGGIRLTEDFITGAYRLCREYDTPTLCDEIQSCMWYGGMFLFRRYGLSPDFAVIGKGFPGGCYPASRLLTTAEMDTLPQFGALVTNGQEELASLSYLVTMAFSAANTAFIDEMGEHFARGLTALGEKYPGLIAKIEGMGHLAALHFHDVETAAAAAERAHARAIDTSAQLYKPHCPPAILFKPPLIADAETLDYLLDALDDVLAELSGGTR